jgi:RNA polymerase sigma-70 factor (ECF subfamily)
MKNSQIVVLAKECLKGDKDSYSLIIRHFQQKVYDLCFYLLGTPQDAEDAAIEVFIKAYHALEDFNPQYAFSTWLSRIAVNHSVSVLRRQKREREYLTGGSFKSHKHDRVEKPGYCFFQQFPTKSP